jgi:hypothetical protein
VNWKPNWSRQTPMPLRAADQIHWCPSTPGLRWARQDSADLIGHGRQRPLLRVIRPPGRELKSSLSSRLVLTRSHNPRTKRIKNNLAIPPQPHVRKKLEPDISQGMSRQPSSTRMDSGWVNCQSFWTGTRRLIASLESKLRFGLRTGLRLTRLSPYRCLAGRLMVRAAN